MPDKLRIWNEALRLLGEQAITSLTDDAPARFALEEAWPDVVLDSLSRGQFNFALKTVTFSPDNSATPLPGYAFAFAKPDDWIFTIAGSEFPDLRDFYINDDTDVLKDSGGFWHSDSNTLTVEYATTDAAQDTALSTWSELFGRFVAANLALDIAHRLTQSTTIVEGLERKVKQRLLLAKNRDARDEKETRVRPGNWLRAQRGYANRLNRERSAVGGQINLRQGKI